MQFSIYSAPFESFSGSHIPSHYTYWRMCLSFLSPLHKKPQLNRFFFKIIYSKYLKFIKSLLPRSISSKRSLVPWQCEEELNRCLIIRRFVHSYVPYKWRRSFSLFLGFIMYYIYFVSKGLLYVLTSCN